MPALGMVLAMALPLPLLAQAASGVLSGVVSGASGGGIANAKVSAKNVATGESTETETNATGMYSFPNLLPGDYDVSVSATGFVTKVERATIAAGATRTAMILCTSRFPKALARVEL